MSSFPIKRLITFAIIGAIGFVVDATILMLMIKKGGAGLYSARAISFPVAVTVTWWLNRHWTFPDLKLDKKSKEYSAYFTIQIIGALINFALYSLCIYSSTFMQTYPVVALGIGAMFTLFFNFFASKKFIYTTR